MQNDKRALEEQPKDRKSPPRETATGGEPTFLRPSRYCPIIQSTKIVSRGIKGLTWLGREFTSVALGSRGSTAFLPGAKHVFSIVGFAA